MVAQLVSSLVPRGRQLAGGAQGHVAHVRGGRGAPDDGSLVLGGPSLLEQVLVWRGFLLVVGVLLVVVGRVFSRRASGGLWDRKG